MVPHRVVIAVTVALDGMGPSNTLGLGHGNAHVDKRGLNHYHGIAPASAEAVPNGRIGWAADGYEIHYVSNSIKPSYMLKR